MRQAIAIASHAVEGFYDLQLLDIAGNGGLGAVEAALAELIEQLLLRLDAPVLHKLDDFFLTIVFHGSHLPEFILYDLEKAASGQAE